MFQPLYHSQSFFKIQYLWNPYAQSVSTALTGFYLILVLSSSPFKVGGTVTTMNNDPLQLVLHQFQPETMLGPIGHPVSFMANWPPLVLYGLLAIVPFPWPYPAIIGLPGQH
ncbi:hypothetical protein O181_111772 [Austropuccinia psidii MF-1]|uniref:Uncharacterized protein n=1 Tax=Austropuccinia psidii MF-1 TaxID=1389203 RepID=A0A9Q3K2F3_9BASI|nr:hypothetical protein [Austropuccinia psidii MF-1]